MEYIIDAENKRLGRLASEIALILQGKKNVDYEPRKEGGDFVRIKNIAKITVSGKKKLQKIYYHPTTGYLGHMKKKTYRQVFEKNPAKVLRLAVSRMLPKNRLASRRIKRLIIE